MVKKSAAEDKEKYIKGICQDVETAKVQNKTRAVYESIQKITRKHAPQVKSVKDEQGKILTDPTAVKVRWKEYFDKLYNDPNSVDENCLVNFPESHDDEDISTIGEDEVEAAVKRMKLKKAASVDNLLIEVIKAATQASGLKVLHSLCKMVWNQEIIPSDWKCSVIIPIHK